MTESCFSLLPNRPLLRPDEVAKFFNISSRTVRRWCDEGKLEFCMPSPQVKRVFRTSVIDLYRKSLEA